MGGTIGNGIGPGHTACSSGGTFTHTTKGKVTAEGATGFNYRDRMGVGEIQIIKGNGAGIGQCCANYCCIFGDSSKDIGGPYDGGNRGGIIGTGDGDCECIINRIITRLT